MRGIVTIALVFAGLVAVSPEASSQVIGAEIRNGDVYLQQQQGWGRLTRDGHSTAVARSRDGRLVAYVHTDGTRDDEMLNSISLCIIAERSCRIIVRPSGAGTSEETLESAGSPSFSYQAGIGPSGGLVGSLFFQTSAYQNMGAIHRVKLDDGSVSFIAPGRQLYGAPEWAVHGGTKLDYVQWWDVPKRDRRSEYAASP